MHVFHKILRNASFKVKTWLLLAVVACTFIVVSTFFFFFIHSANNLRIQRNVADDIHHLVFIVGIDMYDASNHGHMFFQNLTESHHVHMYNKAHERIQANIDRLISFGFDSEFKALSLFVDLIKRHNKLFFDIHDAYQQVGVDKTTGLKGQLRQTIHAIEDINSNHGDFHFLTNILQIRRHEKDFLMYFDQKYVTLIKQEITVLEKGVAGHNFSPDEKNKIVDHLHQYIVRFEKLATLLIDIQRSKNLLLSLNKLIVETFNNIDRDSKSNRDKQRLLQENRLFNNSILFYTGIVVLFLVIGFLIFAFFQSLLKPIKIMQENAKNIANGKYDNDIVLYGSDEIGQLSSHLQEMKESLIDHSYNLELLVNRRTDSLNAANTELKLTVAKLEEVRGELVHSEKMALLGRLVAGFAHEINTPIGVALGSISEFPTTVRELTKLLQEDEVDGNALDHHLEHLAQASELALRNLRRGIEIISSFKRTTVDQSSDNNRIFNVKETIDDVVTSIHNMFKNTQIEIVNQCTNNLNIYSKPGPFCQMLTNLLMNSIKHGFKDGTIPGQIIMMANLDSDTRMFNFKYQDTGKGMTTAIMNNMYEPFFTTERDFGGSGLGMYICYNIVHTHLSGTIECKSFPGKGVVFDIDYPIVDADDAMLE